MELLTYKKACTDKRSLQRGLIEWSLDELLEKIISAMSSCEERENLEVQK
jgi:hypothetical protein